MKRGAILVGAMLTLTGSAADAQQRQRSKQSDDGPGVQQLLSASVMAGNTLSRLFKGGGGVASSFDCVGICDSGVPVANGAGIDSPMFSALLERRAARGNDERNDMNAGRFGSFSLFEDAVASTGRGAAMARVAVRARMLANAGTQPSGVASVKTESPAPLVLYLPTTGAYDGSQASVLPTFVAAPPSLDALFDDAAVEAFGALPMPDVSAPMNYAVTPEPGTVVLTLSGLAGLVFLRRRTRRS